MKGIFAALAILTGATIPALAQDAARLPLVGVMVIGSAANAPATTRFREALAAVGDVEGRNLRLDFRFADGDARRYPEMAEAFVQEKASVIVGFNPAAASRASRPGSDHRRLGCPRRLIGFETCCDAAKIGKRSPWRLGNPRNVG